MALVVTLIANPDLANLTDTVVAAARKALKADNVKWLAPQTACDMTLPGNANVSEIKNILSGMLAGKKLDHVVQEQSARRKKALIADMDSTMIEQECIDELAAEVGLKEKVATITARAMNGEIEFAPALRERVALLAGLPENIHETIIDKRITLARGGKTLVATMRANNAWCVLVSGGFTLFTASIAEKLGFHENHANRLLIENGKLSGKVAEPILGRQAKIDTLKDIAKSKKLSPHDFIAVGDGANDLGMLELAGSGVALHAKPSVAAQADMRIDHGDLTALLYIQGYSQTDFVE